MQGRQSCGDVATREREQRWAAYPAIRPVVALRCSNAPRAPAVVHAHGTESWVQQRGAFTINGGTGWFKHTQLTCQVGPPMPHAATPTGKHTHTYKHNATALGSAYPVWSPAAAGRSAAGVTASTSGCTTTTRDASHSNRITDATMAYTGMRCFLDFGLAGDAFPSPLVGSASAAAVATRDRAENRIPISGAWGVSGRLAEASGVTRNFRWESGARTCW